MLRNTATSLFLASCEVSTSPCNSKDTKNAHQLDLMSIDVLNNTDVFENNETYFQLATF